MTETELMLFPDMEPRQKRRSNRELLAVELQACRKKHGATNRQLAEFLGIPKRTLENWVSGRARPAEWQAKAIREALRGFCAAT